MLDHSTFDEPSLAVYLRKANPTLRNLKICDSNFDHHSNYQNFEELHNLKEISIKLPPPQVLKIHLEQNAQSLERVKLTFHDQKYGGWRLHENNFKLLGTLNPGIIRRNGQQSGSRIRIIAIDRIVAQSKGTEISIFDFEL